MMSPKAHNISLYPNALAVIRKIIDVAKDGDCIFRGEASIYYDYPCSSSLYRQLREEMTPEKTISKRLEERQKKLIQDVRKYKMPGDNDLEKLMFFQHHGVKTNLLDFSRDFLFALFFACSSERDNDKDGRVIVKRKSDFEVQETKNGVPPNNKIVLLEPHDNLQRARDQHGVFLHAPEGRLPLKRGETILIRSKHKREIFDLLQKMHDKSDETIFNDVYGEIERQKRKDKRSLRGRTQPQKEQHSELLKQYFKARIYSFTELRVLAEFMSSSRISVMGYYWKLWSTNMEGRNDKLLKRSAYVLIQNFTNVLEGNPQDFEAYYYRAFVYYSKPDPDYEQAIIDYTQVITLNPNLITVHINRGNAYAKKPNPDYELAIKDYTSELERNPDEALAYYNRGTAQLLKQNPDYEQAISDYTYATELNPDYVEAYHNRGTAYTRRPNPDYERAIWDYTHVIKLDPDGVNAYYNRGNVYVAKLDPNYDKAIEDYTCAIEWTPDFAWAYNGRGIAYMEKPRPDYERAIMDFTNAIEMDCNCIEAYVNRGTAYVKKPDPDYDKAIRDHTRALDLNPSLAAAYYNRGNAYKDKPEPDYDKAIEDYTCAIRLDPNFAAAYNNRGSVYQEKPNPDYDKAISDYNSAIEIIPRYAQAYFNLGVIHTKGADPDYENAVANFSKAVKINPDELLTYFLRATAYAELGDCKRACDDYGKVIKKAPKLKELPLTSKLKKCLESNDEKS